MDSPIQTAASSTPLDMPSTPQLQHAALPADGDIPHPVTPTASILVANSSSPSESLSAEPLPTLNTAIGVKYSSPHVHSSSITPPPSSQPPQKKTTSKLDRATTPSVFSSPPPTALYSMYGVKREPSLDTSVRLPSKQQIENASQPEMREMLQSTMSEVSRLHAEVREARMSAAHYKLQHNLLSIETDESAKRMEVEHEMTRREVEVLQMAELARRDTDSPTQSTNARYIADLKAYCEAVDHQNSILHRRLDRAKRIIAQKDDDLHAVMAENRRFVTRIRENREHLNQLKSPGGIYAIATPRTTYNYPVTPQQHRGTPKQTPRSMHRQDHESSQDSFAALLLADQVLNQENNSAPTTPTTSRPLHRSHVRHSRAVHSLSSLPSTPVRSQLLNQSSGLLPPANFHYPQTEPLNHSGYEYSASHHKDNRKNRDSTISAEDAQEIAAYNAHEGDEEEVEESQASQTASAMLRRDPRESLEVLRTPTPTTAAEKSGLLQAKIFGSVTKTGLEKRKRDDAGVEFDAKKIRTMNEGVGLGINSWD